MKDTIRKFKASENLRILISFLAPLILIIVIQFLAMKITCLRLLLANIVHPFEQEYRPETLTFILTLIISCGSGYFTFNQYNILKNRDLLRLQNLVNRLFALLNYHVESIKRINRFGNVSSLSSEKKITENEIQMIYKMEQLIYEHVSVKNEKDKILFIEETTKITTQMRELIYGLNTVYSKADVNSSGVKLDKMMIDRADIILKEIKSYIDNQLYICTELGKLKGKKKVKI